MHHWLEPGRDQLAAFMAEHNQPRYRSDQIWDWLHTHRVDSLDAMKNIPAELRRLLAAHGKIRTLSELECRRTEDGLTAKWLFSAGEAGSTREEALVESVLIVEKERRRRTVCVSSMAGCPLGCLFCATGRLGFVRNLDVAEIIEQVYRIDQACRAEQGEKISHIVFMGMGEPLLNLDAVLAAAHVFADQKGLGLSGRHITISTAGLPDRIRELAGLGLNYRLALSLHAPNQKLREQIMPIAKRWPLDDLFDALGKFASSSSRDITFEYCLIDKFNASPREARELVSLLSGFRAKVNLIPYNPVAGFDGKTPSADTVVRFRDILENAGVAATIRVEKGREIGAACGQLRAERKGIIQEKDEQ
jgi:23S rRNA m2A2503 methyltransferase